MVVFPNLNLCCEFARPISGGRALCYHYYLASFALLPGAGPALAPRLLAAFGSQRERYRNAAEVQTYSGVAPVSDANGTLVIS